MICCRSPDGGKTVYASNDRVNTKMQAIFESLNLKPHVVKDKVLFSCGDIEGHIGTVIPTHSLSLSILSHSEKDGKIYLLDFARLFPPEATSVTKPFFPIKDTRAVFYKMLRPELVARNPYEHPSS